MNKTQHIIVSGVLALVCAVFFAYTFLKTPKGSPVDVQADLPALAQNTLSPTQASNQSVSVASPTPVAVAPLPPIAEKVAAAATGPDGRDVVTPDRRAVLPAVGQLISSHPFGVDPGHGEPALEFQNKPAPKTSNQLLDPPNPQNVAGPVVSQETR
jgi:hypothetical protein